jgi:hypothetical protein
MAKCLQNLGQSLKLEPNIFIIIIFIKYKLATSISQEVKEMKEKMEKEVSQQLDSRELLLNQREAELTNLQVSSPGPLNGQGKIHKQVFQSTMFDL